MNEQKQGLRPNELRMGNLVYVDWKYDGRKIQECYGLYEFPENDGFMMSTTKKGYGVPLSIVNPILLSEDVLLKVGFEKVRYEKYAHVKLKKLRAYPHVFKNGFCIYIMGAYTLPHIKHLHQLQNLYHALTDEELDVTKLMEG